jgi:hypothetical protein
VDFTDGDASDKEQGIGQDAPADMPTTWSKFGIVGTHQAFLYYSTFLVFSVLFYRRSSIAGTLATPKCG